MTWYHLADEEESGPDGEIVTSRPKWRALCEVPSDAQMIFQPIANLMLRIGLWEKPSNRPADRHRRNLVGRPGSLRRRHTSHFRASFRHHRRQIGNLKRCQRLFILQCHECEVDLPSPPPPE